MKAIVLAAGEGSRMGKLTQNTPKPLVKVNGKSIIERQLSILKQNEILDVIIITGPHNKKFDFEKVRYIHDENFREHDQLGSLMSAKKEIDSDIIILFADIIFDDTILSKIMWTRFSGFVVPIVINEPIFIKIFPSPSNTKIFFFVFFNATPKPIEDANPIEPII